MPALPVTKKSQYICLVVSWVGFGLIWLLWGEDPAFSFLLGGLAAFFYVVMLARQVVKSLNAGQGKSKSLAVRGLFFRYLFLILVLVALISFDWIKLGWVLGGLALIPFSVIGAAWKKS